MSVMILNAKHFNTVQFHLKKVFDEKDFEYSIRPLYDGRIDLDEFFKTIKDISVKCFYMKYKNHHANIETEIANDLSELNKDKSIDLNVIICNEDLINSIVSIDYQIETELFENFTEKETKCLELLHKLPFILSYHQIKNSVKYKNSNSWSI